MAVLNPETPEPSDPARERRSSRRRVVTEIPAITGVTMQSETVQVIDAASGGLLIQSHLRLRPGTRTRLEIERVDGQLNVGGRVVRAEVAGIASGMIQYRTAIALDHPLDFIDQDPFGDKTTAPPEGNLADFVVHCETEGLELEQIALNGW